MLNRKNIFRISVLVVAGMLVQACNVKRFIPEDELLYTGAEIKLEAEDSIKAQNRIKEEIVAVLTPDPNTKILGSRPGLYFHYKAQKENPGFINKFLNKKIGEEPVYTSDVDLGQTSDLINNRLENRGFFYSKINASMEEDSTAKKAKAIYKVNLSRPYRMEKFELDADSLNIYPEIKESLAESYIEPGMRFDLTIMKAERERIDKHLKNRGYYNFNPSFLIFEADTNQYDNKKFKLYLKLKNKVPKQAIIPYQIEKVNIYANYEVGTDSVRQDTVRYGNKNFIQNPEFFKPKYLEPYIIIDEGQYFDPDDSRNTARRLGSIGAYKFVNIRYKETDTITSDSLGKLEANIYLSPLKKRSIRAELQAVTKSNNFAGPGLAVTFTNRNLFRGGEILNLTGKFNYEKQISSGDQRGLSSTQLGLETDLIFPRLLFPVNINHNWFRYSIPKTKISLGGDYLNRSKLFSMLSASARFGYYWDANRYVSHEFNPISLNYLRLANTTQEFRDILDDNPYLRNSFNQEFISGLTYSFIYNGHIDQWKKHQFFLNSTLDIVGNSVDLLSNKDGPRPRTFLGLEYAQYAKADADFRYHFIIKGEQKIATRIFAGYGIPYGNSEVLPFTKQYFTGGPYSVRAFRIRSLGPGTYNPDEDNQDSFFDQSGNIRLEANLEYRFPIISFLKGAAFVDAGNVWNSKFNEELPGGKFNSNFINELGIGGGAGLRVDIQNFVIRFDLAVPFHDPGLDKGDRWTFAIDEPVLNFAIGYPF
ncbi:translocation and assembly module lipoprotein TamL [Salegentibacter sediminis]|uniref:translocation and assembly module lipoprotein TamL n=1 Tax=Salegentibacter sediminis TaxID=1930251 RepID=UPI0009BD8B75|nr:BamA/TamA family outer membrane protein [Salegentibacter sediminis]